jgi:hypothetical protein
MDVPTPNLPGRALTPEQKRAVIERVLAAWEANPQQRLGQLFVNTVHRAVGNFTKEEQVQRLYYVEDETLAEWLEVR